ncbi:4'-phosphopantetheinyl transferase family protein [Streptomyces catenulae]|uniref:4'-phosphopantetheinyl transferase superfamily protein n=1 Tax=Streptomyces catenulae TaxID=66875 RepID=A0ABV2YSQ4_9ACTN|nr:4'-phosphopantetheinyl transferase superfamily protein [Streptomyces catenulae]
MTPTGPAPHLAPAGGPGPRAAELARGPWLRLVTAEAQGEDGVALLDARERQRAAALRRPADRALYIAVHAELRRVLGGLLDTAPDAVELVRLACPGCGGPHGRPAVAGGAVHFSLAHGDGLALLGLAADPIGVDVERVPGARLAADASAALHPAERAALAHLPADARPAAFARCWTRKEAYLKATGEGLSGAALHGRHLGCGPRPEPVPGWTLIDVPVPGGWAAACAVRGRGAAPPP